MTLTPQPDGTLRLQRVEPYINLGWANDWKETPEIVKRCRRLQHGKSGLATEHRTGWSCVTSYTCDECNYRYAVDSSD